MKTKERIEYIDFFRGVGIILMVMGHMAFGGLQGFGYLIEKYIHSFHMPMFFIISGYFYQKKVNWISFVKGKTRTIMLPYIAFGGGYSIIWYLSNRDIRPIFRLLWVNDYDLPYEGALWFLTALFLTTIIFDGIQRIFKKEAAILVMCIICVGIGHITCILNIQLPWSLDAALVGVGLMYVGGVIKRNDVLMNLKWYYSAIMAVIVAWLIYLNGAVNMNGGTYSNIFLFWINAVGATIVGLNWSRYFCEKIPDSVLSGFVSWIGRNSIVFLCCNHIPILVVSKILTRINCTNTVFATVLSILLISLVGWILLSTPLRCILGKRSKGREKENCA